MTEILSIFEPVQGKLYKQVYPELSQIEEFKECTGYELEFAWWMGCPSSPYVIKKLDFRQKAILTVDNNVSGLKLDRQKKEEYVSGKFPERILTAIERFSQMNVSARNRAKSSTEAIFDTLEKMSQVKFSDLCDENEKPDLDKFSKFSNMSISLIKDLPKVIEVLEVGFSITKKAKERFGNTGSQNIADQVLNEEV